MTPRHCLHCGSEPARERWGGAFCARECVLAWALEAASAYSWCAEHRQWVRGIKCDACEERVRTDALDP